MFESLFTTAFQSLVVISIIRSAHTRVSSHQQHQSHNPPPFTGTCEGMTACLTPAHDTSQKRSGRLYRHVLSSNQFYPVWRSQKVLLEGPHPSPLPSPLPSLSLSPPPLELSLVAASGLGERLSSRIGLGRSPAAKRFLVHSISIILTENG